MTHLERWLASDAKRMLLFRGAHDPSCNPRAPLPLCRSSIVGSGYDSLFMALLKPAHCATAQCQLITRYQLLRQRAP